MLRRRPSRPAVARAIKPVIEALEGRRYFITLAGNAEFIFHDPEVGLDVPRQIQVNTTGNISVELIGSSPNQFGGIDLIEIPGTLNGNNVLGGVGGQGGVELLEASGANGINVIDPNGVVPGFAELAFEVEGNDEINFRALAANESGVMYGINVFEFSTGTGTGVERRALLVRFDNVTTTIEAIVIADLTTAILTTPNGADPVFAADVEPDPDVPATVNGVTAAAFDPVTLGGDRVMYFVAVGGVGNRSQLMSVDVGAGTPADIANSVTGFAGTFGSENDVDDDDNLIINSNNVVVNSIAFDQTSGSAFRAFASVTRDDRVVQPGSNGQAFITNRLADVRVAANVAQLGTAGVGRAVTFGGDSVVNVTGIEFANDNETAEDNLLFFITSSVTTEEGLLDQGGAGGGGTDAAGGNPGVTLDPLILRGDLSLGANGTPGGGGALPLLTIGSVVDADDDTVDPIRGTDLQGVTWNPLVNDPITGALGAFVAVDATSDEMVIISTARRPTDADLFHMYISSADEDATLTVVSTEIIGGELVILPFFGAPQPFKATSADGSGLISVTGDEGIGRVWIGGRTLLRPLDPGPPPGFLPRIQAVPLQPFGALPGIGAALPAGISTAPNTTIGTILIGGAVTGRVDITGSIDKFYAGWLLTGNVQGAPGGNPGPTTLVNEAADGASALDDAFDTTDNFSVGGDARTVISRGSIGTNALAEGETNYATQFDAEVGGEAGHFQTYNSLYGGLQVSNAPAAGFAPEDNTEEYETRFGAAFTAGLLGTDFLFNDALDNPQFVNTIGPDDRNGFVRISAVYEVDPMSLEPEPSDTFAVALMSGQTYVFQSTAPGSVSLYDPDGRRVASDVSRFGVNGGQPFRFTTDRPGIYRLQVVAAPLFSTPYLLTVRGAGSVAVGGVVATNDIYADRTSGVQSAAGGLLTANDPLDYTAFLSRRGDFGAMFAGRTIAFLGGYTFRRSTFDFSGRDDLRVDDGDVRALDGGQVGLGSNLNGFGPNIESTLGNIGLLRARTSLLNIETANIGGSLQVADANGQGFIQLNAKGGMAVFRAGDMGTSNPSIFRVNSDESGFDGVIGLIDSQGDFGVIGGTNPAARFIEQFVVLDPDVDENPIVAGGGPQISTGQGGNVRYIHVAGTVFPDIFFGGNEPEGAAGGGTGAAGGGTLYDPGVFPSFRDDGGGTIRLTPIGQLTPNPAFDPLNVIPTDPVPRFLGPQLNVRAYGIRGAGGVVVISVDVSGQGVNGLQVAGSADGASRSVEIGTVSVSGTSATGLSLNADGLPILPGGAANGRTRRKGPLVLDANGQPINRPATGSGALDLNVGGNGASTIGGGGTSFAVAGIGTAANAVVVDYAGSAEVDVFETIGANITSVRNSTNGEMPLIRGSDIAEIRSSASIGIARPIFGTGINPQTLLAPPAVGGGATFPFVQQRVGVVANNVGAVRANKALGNLIVSGAINEVVANAGGSDDAATFEGIVAPVLAVGNIGFVQIGEGLAPSGSGDVARSGVFTGGILYDLVNQGDGSDVMGDILAAIQIRNISLRDGSIINSDIQVNSSFAQGSIEPGVGGQLPNIASSFSSRSRPLGSISLTGRGGIIGSQIAAADIGAIDVDGFGIFTTNIQALNLARIGRIVAANYGVRYVNINAGGSLDVLAATGSGASVSTATFGRSVRFSETEPVDSYFGVSFAPMFDVPTGILTDIHAVLGTSAQAPEIAGVTDTGVIENVDARGGRDLGTASAYQIRTRQFAAVPQRGLTFANQFNFAANIRTLRTTSVIDGLAVTTGRLGTFAPGSDVYRFLATVSSNVNAINVRGTFGEGSAINVIGLNGTIGAVNIDGNLDGTLRATSRINRVYVRGVTTGQIIIDNANGGTNVASLTAAGGIGPENLVIDGGIGRLVIGSGAALGAPGGTLTVNGSLASVQINGGVLDTNLNVNGNLGKAIIKGTLAGDLFVTGDLGTLQVSNAAGATVNSVQGDVSVGGNLRTYQVRGGNVAGRLTVGGTLGTFDHTGGDVLTTATVAIGGRGNSLRTAGRWLASVSPGTFGSVLIGGDLGDGTTPLAATAGEWGTLSVGGSIRAGVTVNVAGTLAALIVRGNVEAGAVVAAGAINRKDIAGAVGGTVT